MKKMDFINSEMKCIKCGRDIFNYKHRYCSKHYDKYVVRPALKKMKRSDKK